MSSEQTWLQQLDEATNYQQLQSVFSQISREATERNDSRQLIASIDVAIQRIEQERSRDANELDDFETSYSQFKTQQRGILGWFRRHLPFTETRRQELGHRDAIADQRAEILADNLVIARAQMLKQRLLPPDERQLGETAQLWKDRLGDCESVDRVGEYGQTLQALIDEMSVSTAFVEEIRAEIDAFAAGKFTSQEDQQRQRDDLSAVRLELAEFESELDEEVAIRSAAIKRAGDLVREQILNSDHEFYELTKQIEGLQQKHDTAEVATAKAEELDKLLDQIHDCTKQLDDCEKERIRLEVERERLRRELGSSEARLDRTSRKLEQASEPYQVAKRAADKSEAAISAANRIYSRHQQAGGGADSGDEIKAEYERLVKEHEDTLQHLEAAKVPYEELASKHQLRKQETESLRKEFQSAEQAADENDNKATSLRRSLQDASGKIPQVLAELEPHLDAYLNDMDSLPFESRVSVLHRSLQWRSVFQGRIPGSIDSIHTLSPNQGRIDEVRKLIEAIRNDVEAIKQLLSSARRESHQRWKQRCHDLLGDRLARQVCD